MSLTECQSAKSLLKYSLIKDLSHHSDSHLLVKAVKSCLHVFSVSSTLMSHEVEQGMTRVLGWALGHTAWTTWARNRYASPPCLGRRDFVVWVPSQVFWSVKEQSTENRCIWNWPNTVNQLYSNEMRTWKYCVMKQQQGNIFFMGVFEICTDYSASFKVLIQ